MYLIINTQTVGGTLSIPRFMKYKSLKFGQFLNKVINLIALIYCVKSYIVDYKKLLKIMVLISYMMIVQGEICSLSIIGSSKIN